MVKGAVTFGGLGLIGPELWWFLLSKFLAESQDESGLSGDRYYC